MAAKKYPGIDNFRLPAAFMVIAIHTAPFSVWNDTADFLLTYCLGRVAVPFFLMVTGCFVLAPYVKSGFKRKRHFCQYLIRNGLLYLLLSLLYLPLSWYGGNLPDGFSVFLRDLFFDGTFYHLWYFPAMLTGCVLVALLMRVSERAAYLLTAVFYVIGLLGDSYFGLIENVSRLKPVYGFLFSVSSYTRNGIFFAPAFLVLGMLCAKPECRCPRWMSIGGLAGSLIFLLTEGYLTFFFKLQRHNSMYLFLIPVMYFLFQLLMKSGKRTYPLCKSSAMIVYIIHPGVIVLVRGFAKITKLTGLLVENTFIHFLAVCMISFGLAAGISLMKQRKRRA